MSAPPPGGPPRGRKCQRHRICNIPMNSPPSYRVRTQPRLEDPLEHQSIQARQEALLEAPPRAGHQEALGAHRPRGRRPRGRPWAPRDRAPRQERLRELRHASLPQEGHLGRRSEHPEGHRREGHLEVLQEACPEAPRPWVRRRGEAPAQALLRLPAPLRRRRTNSLCKSSIHPMLLPHPNSVA